MTGMGTLVTLFLDAIYESLRLQGGVAEGLLWARGMLADGRKVLLHLALGNKDIGGCTMMWVTIGLLFTVAVFGVGGLAPDQWASAEVAEVVSFAQGTIDSLGLSEFWVTSVTGVHTRVGITEATFMLGQLPARFEDIKVGDFIDGSAREEADGSLTALGIGIFGPGVRERMGILEQSPKRPVGNLGARVFAQYVSRVTGTTVSLAFKEGTVTIMVPPNTRITRLVLLAPRDLRMGMRVTVRGSKNSDGSVTAAFVEVERPGP